VSPWRIVYAPMRERNCLYMWRNLRGLDAGGVAATFPHCPNFPRWRRP